MDSVVIDRDARRAARIAAAVAAQDRSESVLNTIRAQGILRLLPERDLQALLRQSSTRLLPKSHVLFRSRRRRALGRLGAAGVCQAVHHGAKRPRSGGGDSRARIDLRRARGAERCPSAGGRNDADVVPGDGVRRRAVPALARRHAGGDVRGDPTAGRAAVRVQGAGDGRGIAARAGATGEGAAASGEPAFGTRRGRRADRFPAVAARAWRDDRPDPREHQQAPEGLAGRGMGGIVRAAT